MWCFQWPEVQQGPGDISILQEMFVYLLYQQLQKGIHEMPELQRLQWPCLQKAQMIYRKIHL